MNNELNERIKEIEKHVYKCENCGREQYTLAEEFTCTKCGHLNKIREEL